MPSRSTFDSTHHVTRGGPGTHKFSTDGSHFTLKLPWTKTTKHAGASVCVPDDTSTGSLHALRNHLTVNAAVPPEAPFFAFSLPDGGWQALDKGSFLRRYSGIWSAGGLDSVFGHSFRIGGCTDLLLRGVHPTMVAKQGRWSSNAFMTYMRDLGTIIPQHLRTAFAASPQQGLGLILAAEGA